MASDLVLVANAADATVSTFALDAAGQRLEPLATSAVGRGCSTFVVDEDRDIVITPRPRGRGRPRPGRRLLPPRPHDRRPHPARTRRRDRLPLPGTRARRACRRRGIPLRRGDPWVLDGEGGIATRSPGRLAQRPRRRDPRSPSLCRLARRGPPRQYLLGDDGRLTPLDPPTVPAPPGSGLAIWSSTRPAPMSTSSPSSPARCSPTPVTRRPGPSRRLARQSPRDRPGLRHSRFGADPTAEHLIWGADIALARGGRLVLSGERCESTLASLGSPTTASPAPCSTSPTPSRNRAVSPSPPTDGMPWSPAERASTVELVAVGADGSLRSWPGPTPVVAPTGCAPLRVATDPTPRRACSGGRPDGIPFGSAHRRLVRLPLPFCHLGRRRLALALQSSNTPTTSR